MQFSHTNLPNNGWLYIANFSLNQYYVWIEDFVPNHRFYFRAPWVGENNRPHWQMSSAAHRNQLHFQLLGAGWLPLSNPQMVQESCSTVSDRWYIYIAHKSTLSWLWWQVVCRSPILLHCCKCRQPSQVRSWKWHRFANGQVTNFLCRQVFSSMTRILETLHFWADYDYREFDYERVGQLLWRTKLPCGEPVCQHRSNCLEWQALAWCSWTFWWDWILLRRSPNFTGSENEVIRGDLYPTFLKARPNFQSWMLILEKPS